LLASPLDAGSCGGRFFRRAGLSSVGAAGASALSAVAAPDKKRAIAVTPTSPASFMPAANIPPPSNTIVLADSAMPRIYSIF
jgi:hypothetical protein